MTKILALPKDKDAARFGMTGVFSERQALLTSRKTINNG
jgi:hypothetical protein